MLLFDDYDIKVYAAPLRKGASGHGPGRSIAERAGVKALLREAFPERRDIYVAHRESGAPYLASLSGVEEDLPEISISHSRTLGVLALAPGGTALGIDTETPDRASQLVRLAPRFLSDAQIPYWGSSPATLFWAWTIKEAVYKAAGRPGFPVKEIPLPMEVPLERVTEDGTVTVDSRIYYVFQIHCPDPYGMLMLVFSAG